VEVQILPQIVNFTAPNHHSFEGVIFTFGEILEQREFHNVSRSIVWHFKGSLLLDLLCVLAIKMVNQGFALVHGGSRHLGWPVMHRSIPEFHAWFFAFSRRITALVFDVFRIVRNPLKGSPIFSSIIDCLSSRSLQIFRQPSLEIGLRIQLLL